MFGSRTTNSSNAKSAALVLQDKQLLYESVPRRTVEQRSCFDDAWAALIAILGTNGVKEPSAKVAATKLRVPFTTHFNNEEEFDQAIYDVFKDCLIVCQSNDKDFFFVLQTSNNDDDHEFGKEYAVGLARHKAVARDLYPANKPERVALLTENSASGMSCDSLPDHAVCLFEKDELGTNKWTIKDCFAIIELKTSNSTCADFVPHVTKVGHVQKPELASEHRALGQTLLYNLGCVLPFHARRGTLGTSVPVAMIAGKKKIISSMNEPGDKRPREQEQNMKLASFGAFRNTTDEEVHITPAQSEACRNESLELSEEASNQIPPFASKKQVDEQTTYEVEAQDPKKLKVQGMLRWVFASINIPEACGRTLHYSILDYDKFCTAEVDEQNSIEQAMVLYINTFVFGLRAARRVLDEMENDRMSPPKPASGQCLYVGSQRLNWGLCASPIPGANPVHNDRLKHWKVSQGELFTGTLKVKEALASYEAGTRVVNFLDIEFGSMDEKDSRKDVTSTESVSKDVKDSSDHTSDDEEEGTDSLSKDEKDGIDTTKDNTESASKGEMVIIKVSSRTVHFYLVDPLSAYKALGKIKSEIRIANFQQRVDQSLIRSPTPNMVLLQEIRSVLYAATYMGAGMMTIMADLSLQGYGVLSVEKFVGKVSIVWDGFCNLVVNVLLPLAKMDIIHADIRPGYDETSNVLCKVERSGSSFERADLKLIDFDSIVELSEWNAPSNGSYVEKQSDRWTATTFVWWQCLAVAYAWNTKTNAATFFNCNGLTLVSRLEAALTAWLPEFQGYTTEDAISEGVVLQTLAKLANDFRTQDQ